MVSSCHWPVLARASWSAEKAGTSDRALAISLGMLSATM